MSDQKFQFLEALAERLQTSASVKTIYGEPVVAQGRTIISVGRVAYGLGGGYGKIKFYDEKGQKQERPGESGGGGIAAMPLGVFEISQGETRFIPLRKGGLMWAGAFLAGLVIGVLLKR